MINYIDRSTIILIFLITIWIFIFIQVKSHIILDSDNRKQDEILQYNSFGNRTITFLKDYNLRNGEIKDDKHDYIDTIIRYDKMFGLVSDESVNIVWKAPYPTFGQIWPKPSSESINSNIYKICDETKNLKFNFKGPSNYILQGAIKRYNKIICVDKRVSYYPTLWKAQEPLVDSAKINHKLFKDNSNSQRESNRHYVHYHKAELKGLISQVDIFISELGESWPHLNMNESYSLYVDLEKVTIKAKETWGVLRALESLSQLVWQTKSGGLFINASNIVDIPRFKYRGIMLDTARHFIPKSLILKNIEGMSMNKFNVFHWHLTDDQSFPLLLKKHPEITLKGAYNPKTKIYTYNDVKEIIEFARVRGIRVIPEIDTPSHSLVFRNSHPEILTRCIDQATGKWNGRYGAINMAAESTYELIKDILQEILELFPDEYVHLGTDEVAVACISSNPSIQKWMRDNSISGIDALIDLYTRRLQNIITLLCKSTGKKRNFIVWQESFDRNSKLKVNTVVQLWKSKVPEMFNVIRQQIPVIYSTCWYLDLLEYGSQWVNYYQCDPFPESGSMDFMNQGLQQSQSMMTNDKTYLKYLLGGEAAMWTEYFDAQNVLPRIWPLACAISERLWSPSNVFDINLASYRLEEQRCRMLQRGIPVGVASGAGTCPQDYDFVGYNSAIDQPLKTISNEPLKPAKITDNKNENSDSYHYQLNMNFPETYLRQFSSFTLIKQLITNAKISIWVLLNMIENSFNPPIVLLLLLAFALFCRYRLHIYMRKIILWVTCSMTIYLLIWIGLQYNELK